MRRGRAEGRGARTQRRRATATRGSRQAPPHEAWSRSAIGTGVRVGVRGRNPGTGSTRTLELRRMPRGGGEWIARALDGLTEHARALGLATRRRPEWRPDPTVERTSSGVRAVHVRQNLGGVPVLGLGRSVRFDARGAIRAIVGDGADLGDGAGLVWAISASAAVAEAAAALLTRESRALRAAPRRALERLARDGARVLHEFRHVDHPTVLIDPAGRWRIAAQRRVALVDGAPAPCWEVALGAPPEFSHRVVVHAGPRVRRRLVRWRRMWRSAASAWVRSGPPAPAAPLVRTPWPDPGARALAALPWRVAAAQRDWTEGGATEGPFAIARFRKSSSKPSALVRGVQAADGFEFGGPTAGPPDLCVLQLFHWAGFLHDVFESLGFDDASGALQRDNAPGVTGAGDPLEAFWQLAPLEDSARLVVAADGRRCQLIAGPQFITDRPTALDPDVVIHEYVHAISDRLVGGRDNVNVLASEQGAALSEGWSDYFALTIAEALQPARPVTFGAWSTEGGRRYRQHDHGESFPARYRDLAVIGSAHDRGSVWCEALLRMHDALIGVHGRSFGRAFAWQLVIDGMRTLPAEPNFVDARSAIFACLGGHLEQHHLTRAEFDESREAMWAAFAELGLGFSARSDGAGVGAITEASDVPPDAVG